MYEYIAPYITMLQPQRMFPVTYRDHEVSKTPVDLSNVKEADTYRKSEQENQTTAAENAKLEKYLLGIESGDSNNTFDPDDLEDLDERTMNYWDKAKVQGGNSRLSGTPDGFVGPATATFDYFSEDIFTMFDPNASVEERMLASVFVLPTPAKFLKPLDDVASGLKKGKDASRSTSNVVGRNGAFRRAKRDAGIPKGKQPDAVNRVEMRKAEYEGGHVVKDKNGKVIMTREYVYTNNNGQKVIIQDHSAGHLKGGQGPHYNVRPVENTRTGRVLGTWEHYPFQK